MTYQLHISHYRSDSNDARLLMYSMIFLSLLFLSTLGVALNLTVPQVSIANLILGAGFLIGLGTVISKKSTIPFVNIHDNTLEYFCPGEGQIISIPSREISKITTRFNELNIHTNDRIHSLNLALIRHQQTRWEIKEMIRQMARS